MSDADQQLSKSLQDIAAELHKRLVDVTGDDRVAFTLLVWNKNVQYVSNADQADVIPALEQFLDHVRKVKEPVPLHHKH